MSEQLITVLVNSGAILVVLALWGGGIAFIVWDTSQRNLAGGRLLLWLAVALIPALGLAIYLIARPFLPQPSISIKAGGQPKKRVTFLKAPDGPKRMPTIPAIQYLQENQPKRGAGPLRSKERRDTGLAGANHRYIFLTVEGPHIGQNFVIADLPAYIGRGPGCTIRLDNDRGVSRRHAELYQQAGMLRLRDLDSTHGTNVNDYNIDDKGLTPGDKIRVGYSLLIVKTER